MKRRQTVTNREELLARCGDVQQIGTDKYKARCPAHDDHRASLYITLNGHTQPVIMRCHVCGANGETIAPLIGIQVADLCKDNGAPRQQRSGEVAATAATAATAVRPFDSIGDGVTTDSLPEPTTVAPPNFEQGAGDAAQSRADFQQIYFAVAQRHADAGMSIELIERRITEDMECAPDLPQDADIPAIVETIMGCVLSPTPKKAYQRIPAPAGRKRFEIREFDGRLFGTKVRIDGGKLDDKKTWWEWPNRQGSVTGIGSVKAPLYGSERLATLKPGSTVILVEGERSAKALNDLHDYRITAVATVTGATQAATWEKVTIPCDAALKVLTPFNIAIWADNDEAGRIHAHAIIHRLGKRFDKGVDRVRWSEAPHKGDAADFIGNGFGVADVLGLLATATRTKYEEGPPANSQSGDSSWPPWGLSGAVAAVAAVAATSLERPEKPLKPVAPLIPDMLPAGLRDWVVDESERLGVPPEYVAVPAILSAGILIGRKVAIMAQARNNWFEIPNVWGAAIGEPGWKKSPSTERGLKFFREIKNAQKAAHRAAAALNPQAPPTTLPPRYESNDATVEQLAILLERDYPRGILLFVQELQGWFNTFNRAGRENDRQFYLAAWSGKTPHTVDRVGRPSVELEAAVVALYGEIQPDLFRSHVYETRQCRDGMLPRFQILVFPDPLEDRGDVDRLPDNVAESRARAIFEKLDWSNLDTFVGATSDLAICPLPFLRFSPEAQQIADKFRAERAAKARDPRNGPLMADHLQKYDKLMLALAEIFHLMNVVDGADSAPVSVDATSMAIRWCDFLETHAQRAYALIENGPKSKVTILAAHIAANSLLSPFRSGDVLAKHWAELTNLSDVEDALETLVEIGWLVPEVVERPLGKGGKPKRRFWIHPAAIDRNAAPRRQSPEAMAKSAGCFAVSGRSREVAATAATAATAPQDGDCFTDFDGDGFSFAPDEAPDAPPPDFLGREEEE
jgi:hypothetical protein